MVRGGGAASRSKGQLTPWPSFPLPLRSVTTTACPFLTSPSRCSSPTLSSYPYPPSSPRHPSPPASPLLRSPSRPGRPISSLLLEPTPPPVGSRTRSRTSSSGRAGPTRACPRADGRTTRRLAAVRPRPSSFGSRTLLRKELTDQGALSLHQATTSRRSRRRRPASRPSSRSSASPATPSASTMSASSSTSSTSPRSACACTSTTPTTPSSSVRARIDLSPAAPAFL